jgi:predicted aspartyl protease
VARETDEDLLGKSGRRQALTESTRARPAVAIMAALAASTILAVLAGSLRAQAGQCRVAKAAEMPMTYWHNRIFVPVSVNEMPGTFLLDTGAFNSTVNTEFASRANVVWDRFQPQLTLEGVGGKQTRTVRAGRLRMLEFGGLKIPDREMPIAEVDMQQPNGAPVDGILGAELLSVLDLEIDFRSSEVTLWRLYGCADIAPVGWTGDYASIPLHRTTEKQVTIPIWLDGALVQSVLDTDAGGLVLDRKTALAAGATEAELAQDPAGAALGMGGRVTGRRHHFKLLLIGKDVYHDVTGFVTDTKSMEGKAPVLVGMSALRNHRAWFSYGTETLFLQSLSPAAKQD